MEKATFGAGCFWGIEAAFRGIEGVASTAVGYTGGTHDDPTYQDVCSGRTGHAEAVQVTFDPSKVTYEQLLEVFWEIHDPTTLDRQGFDFGTQYRSAIFFHDADQETAAKSSRDGAHDAGKFRNPIVTEIVPAARFYRAEEYHQKYFEKRGAASHA